MNPTIPTDAAFAAHRAAAADDVAALTEIYATHGVTALETPLPNNSHTPLSIAVLRGCRRAAERLIELGVDAGKPILVVYTHARGGMSSECTALQLACRFADAALVGAMLQSGPDRTMLAQFAARNADDAVIRLLGRSMSIDAPSAGERPSHVAARNSNPAVLSALIDAGCDVHAVDSAGCSLAHSAASNANARLLAMVLAAGVDPNARNAHGQTPCHFAAANHNADVLALLLAVDGIDINAVDDIGRRPCDMACANQNSAVIAALLARGGTFGALPVACFAALAHIDTLRLLVEHPQFDTEARNPSGQTVLLHAAHSASAAVVALLLSVGADKHATCLRYRRSVCHYAAMNTLHSDVMRTLIAAGADARALDRESQSALHVACTRDNMAAIDTLAQAGIDVVEAARSDTRVAHCAAGGSRGLVLQRLIRARVDVSTVPCHRWSDRAAALLFAAGVRVDVRGQLSQDEIFALPVPTLIACGADVGTQALTAVSDFPGSVARLLFVATTTTATPRLLSESIDTACKELAERQFQLMRLRGFEIAVGLQPLELSALVLTEILAHMFAPLESLVPFHRVWNIVTTVKHFSA